MNVTVTKEGNEATLKITAPAADVAKSFKQAVTKLANQAKIPGFRKGKAPRFILERYLGADSVKAEAFEILANKLYGEALEVNAEDDAIIEKGDFAMIDFKGTVDGEPFDGGEGKSYPLEVGSGSFIPGFEDQLIGLKKGDDTDVDVTFPEDYFVKELAGKEAVFKVTVQGVRRKELPELTDEYVANNSEYKTIEEIKAAYRKRMEEAAERNSRVAYENELVNAAVANAKLEIPETMIEQRIDNLVEEIRLNLQSRKLKLDDYLKYTGMDMAKLREAQRARAAEGVRTDLVLDAIAKAENIQVSMEDVDAEIAQIANEHGARVEEVRNIISANRNMGLLLANILRRKSAHVIIDSAK